MLRQLACVLSGVHDGSCFGMNIKVQYISDKRYGWLKIRIAVQWEIVADMTPYVTNEKRASLRYIF